MDKTRHIPVLLNETIEALNLRKGMTVVDATLGGGGYAMEIAKRILPGGRLIALDADESAIGRFRRLAAEDGFLSNALTDGSIGIVHSNFSDIGMVVGEASVDAIVADLGFSSDQVEDAGRGFSFRLDGPLDMRLDRRTKLTARDVVNGYSEGELVDMFRKYGEEPDARRIARAICDTRKERHFDTTGELADCVEGSVARRRLREGIHPATKVFQAIRMEVNDEIGSLERFLETSVGMLRHGGRVAVVTFHSGEDRVVKRFFKEAARGCVCPPNFPECRCGRAPALKLSRPGFVRPSQEEIMNNPRARSAKLRIAEKS